LAHKALKGWQEQMERKVQSVQQEQMEQLVHKDYLV